MPQLWTETLVTQYFWLVLILLGFYYLAVTTFIPQIAFTLKARKVLDSEIDSNSTGLSTDPLLGSTKSLLSNILTPKLPSTKATSTDVLSNNIYSVRTNWSNKHSS